MFDKRRVLLLYRLFLWQELLLQLGLLLDDFRGVMDGGIGKAKDLNDSCSKYCVDVDKEKNAVAIELWIEGRYCQ